MFEERNFKNKIIILVCLIIFVLVIGIIYIISNDNKKLDSLETNVETIVEETVETNTIPVVEEVPIPNNEKQDDANSVIKAKVLSVLDNTSTVQYNVFIGSDDTGVESSIIADSNTIVYDASLQRIIGVNGIKDNMEIMFYGTGNYKVGNLKASALVIGGSNNMRFGKLSEIYQENDGIYIGKISNTKDFVNITSNTLIENGYTGYKVNDLRRIEPNSLVFYFVDSDFEQKSDGLYYNVSKIVIVKDGQ